jgi:hypothetical protein
MFIKHNVTGVFFKFGVKVGVELSIVNAVYRLRITDQLFKSYAFTRVVRSQSTLQRLLRRQIKKKKHPLRFSTSGKFTLASAASVVIPRVKSALHSNCIHRI